MNKKKSPSSSDWTFCHPELSEFCTFSVFWLCEAEHTHPLFLQGSPFTLNVKRKLRRHSGTFHCCSFCSSGGAKEARCGCAGTMPGNQQMCSDGQALLATALTHTATLKILWLNRASCCWNHEKCSPDLLSRLPAGGFKGCGHGHKGHPGKPHWSCCGSTVEQSECLPASVIAAVSPRGHLRTVELWDTQMMQGFEGRQHARARKWDSGWCKMWVTVMFRDINSKVSDWSCHVRKCLYVQTCDNTKETEHLFVRSQTLLLFNLMAVLISAVTQLEY